MHLSTLLYGADRSICFSLVRGAQIGSFMDCEDQHLHSVDRSLCFKVDIDVAKPLRRGVRVLLAGKPTWIQIKYVKLPDFCYGCGRLGHVLKGCLVLDFAKS